jgi:hypothetical protein
MMGLLSSCPMMDTVKHYPLVEVSGNPYLAAHQLCQAGA